MDHDLFADQAEARNSYQISSSEGKLVTKCTQPYKMILIPIVNSRNLQLIVKELESSLMEKNKRMWANRVNYLFKFSIELKIQGMVLFAQKSETCLN